MSTNVVRRIGRLNSLHRANFTRPNPFLFHITPSPNMNVSERLAQAGLKLPSPINPLGSYRTVSVSGSQLYVSGLGPFEDGKPIVGMVGREISLEKAQDAARLTMLMILACVEQACGLDNIERCSRLTVYVRAEQSFTQHPQVANGASDLLLTLFGQDNLPARSALGVHSLPMGIPVEIDSIFELKR
ncbi:RidA family protein [Paraburkholderia hospita]|nr:RidA family protein [Paraburkholderia hospita]